MKKRILITGSTDGIGKMVAEAFAKDGHEVRMHGRNGAKLNAAIAEVKINSGNPDVLGYQGDLSDFSSMEKMVSEILVHESHFDVWINNAGIFKSPVENSAQGIDIRLAVNFLAPMYLVDKLGGLLDKAQQPRLINLSSAAQAPVSLDAVTGLRSLGVQEAYAQSKLALTMWSFDLAKKTSAMECNCRESGILIKHQNGKRGLRTALVASFERS